MRRFRRHTHLFCFVGPLYFDDIASGYCYWDNVMRNNSLIVTENLSLKFLVIIVVINILNSCMASRRIRVPYLKFIINFMVMDYNKKSSAFVTGVFLSLLDVTFPLISWSDATTFVLTVSIFMWYSKLFIIKKYLFLYFVQFSSLDL